MKRILLPAAILATALALLPAAPASARTYVGFSIGIGSAPPPPHMYFRQRPAVTLVPSTQVYVVQNDDGLDMFRYGRFWYVMDNGYWYRSSRYNGSFRVIDVRSVPQQILYVPASNWRHHPHGGPPGQSGRDRDRGRGHGRGNSGY